MRLIDLLSSCFVRISDAGDGPIKCTLKAWKLWTMCCLFEPFRSDPDPIQRTPKRLTIQTHHTLTSSYLQNRRHFKIARDSNSNTDPTH